MICSRNFAYIIIILSFPLQFGFHMNFFTHGSSDIQSSWDLNKVSPFLLDVANRITNYFGAVTSIIFIFINYKIKRRRLVVTILYIFSGITWLVYLAVTDSNIWLSIVLRATNGFFLGYFQSSHISYMMHFSQEKLYGFHTSLIEVTIALSISILNVMLYLIHWKIVAVILSIQSFIFGGLFWLIPEHITIPKTYSRLYIHNPPYLKYCLIMASIMILQCFAGIGFMIDNCSRLMSDIGINMDAYIQLALVNLISCISALIGSFIVDAVDIPAMWSFSSFGIAASLIIYDITLKADCPKWLGVFSVFLYFLFFGFGEGTIPWMLPGIIFPESLMIESGALNTFTNQFMGIWFGYFQNVLTKEFGEFSSVMFSAIVSFLAAFYGLFMIPHIKKNLMENITVF